MAKYTEKLTAEWQDVANLILGAWLGVSPWMLAFAPQQVPAWNAIIVGLVIALAAAGALYAFHVWEEWLNGALAVWLVISPWILGFSTQQVPTWNQIIVGVLVGVLALWSANIEHGSGRPAART